MKQEDGKTGRQEFLGSKPSLRLADFRLDALLLGALGVLAVHTLLVDASPERNLNRQDAKDARKQSGANGFGGQGSGFGEPA